MGSKQKQTRQLQLEHFEQLIANRKALLTEKGIEENNIQLFKCTNSLALFLALNN